MAISSYQIPRLVSRLLYMRWPSISMTCRYSSRVGCKKESKNEECHRPFKSFPCGKPELQAPPTKPKKKKKFESMWPNPFCEETDFFCPFNPRFDDLYYIESDKAKRKYWQTWVACPPLQIKKKKICCFEKTKLPPIQRRKHRIPKTACVVEPACHDTQFPGCLRLRRHCHKAGRIPPDCHRIRSKTICTKVPAPYPSFSECKRLKSNAMPLSECVCWQKTGLCDVWTEWRRRNILKKGK